MVPSPDRPLRIGTRGSPLALAQARMAADALCAAHGWGGSAIVLVPIATTGDAIQNRPLADLGGKGLWTKELDRSLAEGETDLSVHSMKDVETIRSDRLEIAAMLPRADPRDRLVGAQSLDSVPEGARFGTSSPRRTAQLLARRPDLDVVPFRGNVQTRLAKLARGEVAATLLAAAGLDRVGLGDVGTALDDLLPAPAQGAVGVEIRSDDGWMREVARAIDHRPTHEAVAAERAFLEALGGDCRSAVAAHAGWSGEDLLLRAEILSPDGAETRAAEIAFAPGEEGPAQLAHRLLAEASPALRALFAA